MCLALQAAVVVLGHCSDAEIVIARAIAASTLVVQPSLPGPAAVVICPTSLDSGQGMRLQVQCLRDSDSLLTAGLKAFRWVSFVHTWPAPQHLLVLADQAVDPVLEALVAVEQGFGREHLAVSAQVATALSFHRLSGSSEETQET